MPSNYFTSGTDLVPQLVSRDYFPSTLPPSGLFSWGFGSFGNLGLGDQANRNSPVQVGSLTTWKNIAAGHRHSAATKTDGSLWTIGSNANGELGLGDTTDRSSPVQVGSLTTWNNIACGYRATVATKTDGSLWAWGLNSYGQLGLGDVTMRSSPVQVGSLLTWKNIACGYSTLATKTDGSLWTWGYNGQGQLGLNDVNVNRNSPVQVGSLTTWNNIACGYRHTLATKTDGSLWSWGYNSSGELGLGDLTPRSSPVQVGSLLTWNTVVAGYDYAVATKTDGSLWSWGNNITIGQLGLGDVTTQRSSPTQIGSLLNWKTLATGGGSGAKHTLAIKTDGSLWSWGYSGYGQLGLGDSSNRNSPVQVGSLLTWKNVTIGSNHTIATMKS